jgi:adenylate cyclase class 2
VRNKDFTEFEAKFYPIDKEKYRRKLSEVGAKLEIPERRMIRVIADSRANAVLKNKGYVRVRDEGNLTRLSLKETADEGGRLSDQKEIDVEVSNFDKTVRILKAVGVKFNRRQETLREEWSYRGAQITLDTWPGLESFSEIEAGSEEEVCRIALELGFDWEKKIITPAAEVYAKVYRLAIDEVLEKISDLSFKKNPFAGLRRYQI